MKPSPLALGLAGGLAIVLALAPATGTALGALARARADRAGLARAQILPPPAPILAPGLALAVADDAAGRAAMVARVQRLARAGGVLVEETVATPANPGLVALRLRVSGSEKAVLALADAVERERPLMRLRSWRIEPVAGGVRLTGELLGVRQ